MPEPIRALIVVLMVAIPAFFVGRRIAASIVTPREFVVWRNAWLALTIAGFLCSDFFVFAVAAALVCLYAHLTRGVTVALFIILLFSVPLVGVTMGVFGVIKSLFEFNIARLLSIFLLLPILLGAARSGQGNGGTSAWPDRLIIGYVVLLIALSIRQANVTSVMRGAVQSTLDILVPYFAFSRTVTKLTDFRKVLLAFVVAVLPLSFIAVLETAKGWPLYNSILAHWGAPQGYAGREGMLRAGASAGPIVLGLIIMVAIGCMLAVRQTTIQVRGFANLILGIFAMGIIATLSRGPWVGLAVLLIIYVATSPKGMGKLGLYGTIVAVALVLLVQTPIGQHWIEYLPFIGSVDVGNVTYRQRLIESATSVIERNLWFGSIDYLSTPEMRKLITGQQIVDVVNTYLGIALDSGVVGLSLFVGFFTTVLVGLKSVLKSSAVSHVDFSVYARTSIATLTGILVAIGTVSSVGFTPYVYWSFAGLCVALIRIASQERAAVQRAALANRVLR
jgi:hypothetical protein